MVRRNIRRKSLNKQPNELTGYMMGLVCYFLKLCVVAAYLAERAGRVGEILLYDAVYPELCINFLLCIFVAAMPFF